MLEQPVYALDDPAAIDELIASYGWATLVSDGGPVVSPLPVIPGPGGSVLGHLSKQDARLHGLGERPVVMIFQGPHGYVSPGVYAAGPYVPTWNYVTVHLHGTPELLDPEETYRLLGDTVDHFERDRAEPWRLESVEEYGRRLLRAVVGFRLRPGRVVAKAKLSQDKPAEVIERVLAEFERTNPALAAAMRKA